MLLNGRDSLDQAIQKVMQNPASTLHTSQSNLAITVFGDLECFDGSTQKILKCPKKGHFLRFTVHGEEGGDH